MTAMAFFGGLVVMALALAGLMAGAWIVQQRSGNSGWVDTIWTYSVGLVGVAAALAALPGEGATSLRQMVVAGLVGLWSLRLGTHIALRTRRITDDPRYHALTEGWGRDAPRRMFVFLQQQAAGSVPLTMAVFLAAHNPAPWRLQDWIAAAVLLAGIAGETIADAQLRRFRADPRNRGAVCDVGLWRYSQHPNYFFEWFGWLAYPLFAIDISGGYPWGWLAVMGPAFMYWILVHVTGIPHLDRHLARTRGATFERWRARTNTFFPSPPRTG